MGVARQFVALGALVMAKKDKTLGAEPLEQQDATMSVALAVHGSQGHAVGLGGRHFGFARLLQPLAEQLERISLCVVVAQAIEGVVTAQLRKGQGHGAVLQKVRHSVVTAAPLPLDHDQHSPVA